MSSWQHRILKEASLDLDREGKKANTCLLLPLKRDKKCLALAACLLGVEAPAFLPVALSGVASLALSRAVFLVQTTSLPARNTRVGQQEEQGESGQEPGGCPDAALH